MLPAPGPGRTVEQLLSTRTQLERHFRNAGLRDAELRRQRLVLQERAMKTLRKGRHCMQVACEEGDHAVAPRRASLDSGTGSRGARSRSATELTQPPEMLPSPGQAASPGLARNRFSASLPLSQHPAVHPGAMTVRSMSESSARFRRKGALSATFADDGPTWDAGGFVRQASPGRSAKPRQWAALACPRDIGLGEDPHWQTGPTEEDRLFDDEEDDACAARAALRPPDPPAALERFGDMLALLGPRYKTLPRGVVWERAVFEGTTTPLQRRLMRHAQPPRIDGIGRKRVPPEDLPDQDSEKAIRASWLAIRRQVRLQQIQQREGQDRGAP